MNTSRHKTSDFNQVASNYKLALTQHLENSCPQLPTVCVCVRGWIMQITSYHG